MCSEPSCAHSTELRSLGGRLLTVHFYHFRAIIIRNGEIIPMSSEFTPETERQRLQYLVRVMPVWWNAVALGMVSELFQRNVSLLTWEQAHSSQTTYGLNSPPHTFWITHPSSVCDDTLHLREFIIVAVFLPSVTSRRHDVLCFF